MLHVTCYVKTVLVKINRWENPITVFSPIPLSVGDVVVVETADGFLTGIVESARVEEKNLAETERPKAGNGVKISRKANLNDLKIISEHAKKEAEALKICREEVKKSGLPMKLVDAAYSFDGGSITFAFIADGRVDFRDLVKNLSKQFQRSIRLHQIGARDESRQCGSYGICGRELCCVKFRGNLPSISSEMAKIQQIAHRGSERISGVCGRLMCCLAYEADQYREMLENLPKPGETIKHEGKNVVVKEVNAISGEIRAELADKSIVVLNKIDLD